MPTSNIAITDAWTKLADASNTEFLATWNTPVTIEVATTSADSAPTVAGHQLSKCYAITRTALGAGFIWARVSPASIPASTLMVVSK